MIQQLINDEKFTNIQRAQAGLTKLFAQAASTSSFYRVLRNDQSLGVLVPEKMWVSLVEDLEALSSPSYLAKIAEARAGKKSYTFEQIKKEFKMKLPGLTPRVSFDTPSASCFSLASSPGSRPGDSRSKIK